jgi:hypothetical protein
MSFRVVGLLIVTVLVAGAALPWWAAAQAPIRLYVAVDKSHVLALPQEPFTKVSVTNPNIADVFVITPTQIMINGKAVGVTSLVLFYAKSVQHFDLVVHPPQVMSSSSPLPGGEPHGVLVHRADKLTERLFVRDKAQQWVELGTVKAEPPADKK